MLFASRRLKNAYKIGAAAYKKGKMLSENPYSGRFSKARRRKTKKWIDAFAWTMINGHEEHSSTLAGQWTLGWRNAERSE